MKTEFLSKVALDLHKHAEASKWLEESECSSPAALGVAILQQNNEYTFEPASMSQDVRLAINSIGLPITFTMSSEISSAVFAQISQYQTEIVIQPRGTRIPVVNSLQDIPTRIGEIKQIFACLVKKEKIVMLFANTLEGATSQAYDIEQMLMETVRYILLSIQIFLEGCNGILIAETS